MTRPATIRLPSRSRRALAAGGVLALGLASAAPALAQSCAMCASSFGPDDPIARAFNWSILFLMAAPYTVVGAVAGWLFFTYRRASGRRRAAVVDLARVRCAVPAEASPGGDVP